MRLQTDLEFNQNQIKKLNGEFNVEMFHTKIRGGKAFAAEQKIREFKKTLLRSKRFEKMRKNRIKPNDLIEEAAQNMNETISTKYNLPPETIEKRSLDPNDGKYFQEIYDFIRVRKIENNQKRNDKYDQKIDRRKRTLRSPLNLDEKVLVLTERLEKKDAPGNLYKASTDNMPFFAIGKGFSSERPIIKGLNLIFRLNEKQTLIKSFFLHRSPRGSTEYLNFFLWEKVIIEI